jgi:hypothetical protein
VYQMSTFVVHVTEGRDTGPLGRLRGSASNDGAYCCDADSEPKQNSPWEGGTPLETRLQKLGVFTLVVMLLLKSEPLDVNERVANLLRDILRTGGAEGLEPLTIPQLNFLGSILDQGGWRFHPEEPGLRSGPINRLPQMRHCSIVG